MAEPYLGEIRLFACGYEPDGWALCDGRTLPIMNNQTLYSLIGTTYGGSGTSFALPDLRGRVPAHISSVFHLGLKLGAETERLSINQVPTHSHTMLGSAAAASTVSPAGGLLADATLDLYAREAPNNTLVQLSQSTIELQGGSQPHENRQPYLAVSFCIALRGIYPPRAEE